ncbi:RNA-binding protein 33-like [Penaeus japonicus]|uniref:RNA-binding protein 33-like n=1 Tax=Penaeus japonicus TaxID=27405 RepID=UPI001C716E09|nr:RNA-binding protein 33-like [Penaeus japonicus]
MKVVLLKCFLIAVSASLVRCDEETQRDTSAGDQVTARSGHEASLTERDKPGDSDDLKRLPTTTTSPPEEGGLKALLKSASKEVEVDLLKIPTNDSEAPASSVESEDQLTERQDFVSGPTVNPDRFGLALRHIHRRPPIRHPPIPLPPPLPPHPSATRHPIPKHHPPPHPPRPDHDHAFPPPDFDFDPPDFFENSGIPHPDDEPFAFGAPFEGHDHEHDPFFSPHLDDDFPPHDDDFSPHDDHFPPHDFDVSSPHDDHFSEPPPPLKPFSEDPIVVFPKRPPPHKHPRPSKHPSKHPPPPPLPPPPPSPPHSHHHHHHHPPLHFPSLHLNFITEESIYRDDVPFKETHNERDRIHPGLTPAGVQGLDPGFISYIKEQTKPYIDSESKFRFER